MKIAVVGCGIGGLAVANLLARDNNELTLYDQFDSPAPVGSGLVIQPVGLRILEKLGADKEVLAKGARGYRMLGYEAVNKCKVLDVSYGPKSGTNFGLGIHRASLFEALLNACTKQGVTITHAHTVTTCHLEGHRRYLTFQDGSSAGPYDLVIDAAGAKSPLSPLKSKTMPYGAIWGTVDWPKDTDLHYDQLEQRYRRASMMIGVLPIGTLPACDTPKAALFWSLPQNAYNTWHSAPLSDWKSEATALWPEISPFIAQIKTHDDLTMARYTHGTLRKPYSQELVHIGDAAHRASPQLGQGANMALFDAYALAQSVQQYPLEQALPAYVKSRKMHVGLYQAMSWAFTPMYQSDSRVLPFLRDRILGPFSTIPPIFTMLTSLVKGSMIKPYRGFK